MNYADLLGGLMVFVMFGGGLLVFVLSFINKINEAKQQVDVDSNVSKHLVLFTVNRWMSILILIVSFMALLPAIMMNDSGNATSAIVTIQISLLFAPFLLMLFFFLSARLESRNSKASFAFSFFPYIYFIPWVALFFLG